MEWVEWGESGWVVVDGSALGDGGQEGDMVDGAAAWPPAHPPARFIFDCLWMPESHPNPSIPSIITTLRSTASSRVLLSQAAVALR